VSERARTILRETFGHREFRPGQEAVVRSVVSGDDALVLMPTGGGKSLCYQIPALVREGTGIVVSPLIALMKDQVDALLQLGVRAAFLNSSLERDAARRVEQRLAAGDLDLLYVAPERLLTPRMLALLDRSRLALFAIDEAHCVSQWGHDFRPVYLDLSVLGERFPGVPRIALTATADEPTRREITQRLRLTGAKAFIGGFDRPNIRYRVTQKHNAREQLLAFLEAEHRGDAGIVYRLSRRKVEETAQWLAERGWNALAYHAGLDGEIRRSRQERFLREDGVVMVATIAFGMGIDKPDVRFVAHLDLPKSLEAYYQETGRAGRDGMPADAWLAYGLADVILLRRMLGASTADDRHKRVERQRLEAMLGYCEVTTCRRLTLLGYFGETPAGPCGNCDTCLEPVDAWDATEAARKALAAVYRTGQRFGVNYLIGVLLGRSDERARRLGHDRLPTFGVGRELSEAEWRSVFRQLVAAGLLTVDAAGHGSLRMTSSSRAVLLGERRLEMRRDVRRRARASIASGPSATPPEVDRKSALWQALRRLRQELAEEQGVPPYVVFHDAALDQMVRLRPRSPEEFSRVGGVGRHKLARYAERFLAVIRQE
jgi:ATP-dependent DNA helicase RecQ